MKRAAILLLAAALPICASAASPAPDPVPQMLGAVDPKHIQHTIETLVAFGSRSTLSSQGDPKRGIGAARDWLYAEFQKIAATSGGRMTVELQSFDQEPGKFQRIAKTTRLTNVVATLHGTQPESASRVYVVSGHYDSMCTSPTDADCDAPGANDDASGTAAVLEAARVMAPHGFDATIVFMAVAGEEQGLVGSTHFAEVAKQQGMNIAGMFTNDIVGNTRGGNGVVDRNTLRLFSEGVPSNETPEEGATRRSVGGENDSPSRELARFIVESAKKALPDFNVMMVYRRDRYLRGGDHIPFLERGYPAIRFTEPNEDYAHQHQNVRVENGVQYGDLPQFVDFDYIANVARVNVAALAALANAPAAPHDAVVLTSRLTNDTDLQWAASPEPDVNGYEIVWRDTTAPQWEHSREAGKVTSYTMQGLSKDNYIFGVVAVDKEGHGSPAAFPKPKRETRPAGAAQVKQRPDLDAELRAMVEADQKILREQVEKHDNTWREEEFKAQNRKQVARLREIFAELHGWPGQSITSVKGSGAAWTILQHSDPEVLHEFVPMMEAAAKAGELSYALVATSIDRDRVRHDQKQLYGSQFDTKGDKCEPLPIEDPEHVDERRQAAGLGPLADYTKQLCGLFKAKKK